MDAGKLPELVGEVVLRAQVELQLSPDQEELIKESSRNVEP